MEITITHHSVIVKDIQLSETFSSVGGDLILDKKGHVKVIIDKNHFFYVDLHAISPTILSDISDYLKGRDHTRILKAIKYKIDRVLNAHGGHE